MEISKSWQICINILFLILFVPFFYFIVYKRDKIYYLEKSLEFTINQEYQGVIKRKYYNERNHNAPTILFTNGKRITLPTNEFSNFKLGDSINKKSGNMIVEIFRDNRKIEIDIAPFYERNLKEAKEKKSIK